MRVTCMSRGLKSPSREGLPSFVLADGDVVHAPGGTVLSAILTGAFTGKVALMAVAS